MAIRWISAILLFAAVLEFCARADDAWREGAPLLGRYDQSALMMSDEFGIAGRPNAHFAKWRMNSQGFRGPEPRANVPAILCIGASETFGLYEPDGLEFPRQLGQLLPRYQVVNAGLPGQSLSSFARRARHVVSEVKPAIAVIYPSLAIYIDPPPENYIPVLRPAFRLRIGTKLFALLEAHTPQPVQTALVRATFHLQPSVARIPQTNVDRFHRDLVKLIDVLESDHVRVILVTHATRFGPQPRADDAIMLTRWRALHPTLKEEGFADMESRLNQVIRTEAATRGLRLVDAANILHGPEDFVEFIHFTPQGAGKLATAIGAAIGN